MVIALVELESNFWPRPREGIRAIENLEKVVAGLRRPTENLQILNTQRRSSGHKRLIDGLLAIEYLEEFNWPECIKEGPGKGT